ncbi:MFS transporter [Spirochaeta dissipatitropha]
MIDWKDNEISSKQVRRSMRISYISGPLGTVWLITATPQQILTVFVRNYLGASSTQLGMMVGVINLLALLHLASIWFYRTCGGRKKSFFMLSTLVQRSMAFVMSAASFQVAAGGSRSMGILLVLAAAIVAALAGNISGSGWWSWMADLIPADRRAAFFGKRSAISQLVNISFFFSATLVLDLYAEQVFIVYGILFAVGGSAGVLDILLHAFIPEPQPKPRNNADGNMSWREFFLPVRDRNFRRFCLILGMYLFSLNLAAPFLAPYTTDPAGGGAPNVWLGITFVISQLTWVMMVPFWGMLMDRMGKRPVVIIGGLFILSWTGYLFLAPSNYVIVLPLIALSGGLLAPAFWEGISQFMLDLSPDEHRTSYSAWYWTAFGVSGALSPLLGGVFYDFLASHPLQFGALQASPFQTVVVLAILMVLFSLSHMGRIASPRDKSVRAVMSTILNPGVFRAVSNIGILSRPTRADVVQRTLRGSRGGALGLGFAEICIRLDDPDAQVREAAAQALGRLGSEEAQDQLITRLTTPDSLSRPVIARVLGNFHDLDSARLAKLVQALTAALEDSNEDVQVEAASSLGRLSWHGASAPLLRSLKESPSLRVRISSAEAVGRLGAQEAGLEIFVLMHRTDNWILRRQLAIALGDLFGKPGEIYHYMTGDLTRNIQAVYGLAESIEKRLGRLARKQEGKADGLSPDKLQLLQPCLKQAAVRYDRGDYCTAFEKVQMVWNEIPQAVKARSPGMIHTYWEAVVSFMAEENCPGAQDVVLSLYSLYRLLEVRAVQ